MHTISPFVSKTDSMFHPFFQISTDHFYILGFETGQAVQNT